MNSSQDIGRDAFIVTVENLRMTVQVLGRWTYETVGAIDKAAEAYQVDDHEFVTFDLSKTEAIDTSGAYVLARALSGSDGDIIVFDTIGATEGQKKLLTAAAEARRGDPPRTTRPWYDALSRLGEATVRGANEIFDTIAFIGRVAAVLGKSLFQPGRVRWRSVVSLLERVCLDAIPIVVVLSFFIGCVIAFMGAQLLATFGVQIFMVDLVGLAVLREFAVLIMAIMMAARSNSAFTASIGSMVMRQEVDAMTVIGLDTDGTLVAPRALACLISAPILTAAAMLSGILGGAVVAKFVEGITFNTFFLRIGSNIDPSHFIVGMVKAPIFAFIIAVIGCRQGLAVTGSVESLGQRTTSSVVQAIFAVIVLDALFAMFFLQLGY